MVPSRCRMEPASGQSSRRYVLPLSFETTPSAPDSFCPPQLLHKLKHNKVVHETVVMLLGHGAHCLVAVFGFMEDLNLPELLTRVKGPVKFSPMSTSYFLGRETLIATRPPGMVLWRVQLFAWMMRNASSVSHYFALPANQVIELGAQIEI
jgi:KUP system potassium uptake protein